MSALTDDAPRGFVSMREYLALRRRCDALEEQLAARKQEEREIQCAEERWILRKRIGLSAQEARLLRAAYVCKYQTVSNDVLIQAAGCPEKHPHLSVVVHKINAKARDAGGPERILQARMGPEGGRWLTAEGRAWLEKVAPEIFKGADT